MKSNSTKSEYALIRDFVMGPKIFSPIFFPLKNGNPLLGIWQGIYLCEHRNNSPSRKIIVTVYGEK